MSLTLQMKLDAIQSAKHFTEWKSVKRLKSYEGLKLAKWGTFVNKLNLAIMVKQYKVKGHSVTDFAVFR